MVLDQLLATVHIFFTLFAGDYDNLLHWHLSKLIHIGVRDQLDQLYTWTQSFQFDQNPAYKHLSRNTNLDNHHE